MADLIDRNDAIKLLRGEAVGKYPQSFYFGLFAAADEIRKLPTVDAVEVVRCKDCMHSHHYSWGSYSCSFHEYEGEPPVEPDDFCSYGERRTDDSSD